MGYAYIITTVFMLLLLLAVLYIVPLVAVETENEAQSMALIALAFFFTALLVPGLLRSALTILSAQAVFITLAGLVVIVFRKIRCMMERRCQQLNMLPRLRPLPHRVAQLQPSSTSSTEHPAPPCTPGLAKSICQNLFANYTN